MIPRQPAVLQIVACVCALLTAFALRAAPTNGLVAHYPLDGNADDASGNGLNANALNTTPTEDRFGNANGALQFDGDTSYIDCGNRPEWKFNDSFSIACWVKLNGDQSQKYIVAKYDFGNATNAYGLGTAGGSVAYAFLKGDAAPYHDASGGPTLNDGGWHFLTMIYDTDSGLGVFVDGAQVAFSPTTGYPPFADETPLQIGRTFSGQPFGGAIDDVLIYNRALTAQEISDMGPPPTIQVTVNPLSGYSIVGNIIRLSSGAAVSGNRSALLQWFKNDQPIANATNLSYLATRDAVGSDRYKLQFTSGPTVVFSDEATLTFGPTAPAALLAHYTFETGSDTTIVDESGAYPGEGWNVEYVPGRVGSRALRFNGTNSFVRIPYPASPLDLAGTPYTIAFWMKPENKTEAVIWMGDSDLRGGYSFVLQSAVARWQHGSGSDAIALTGYRPNTNWIHVAMVWNGAVRTLYMNGSVSNSFSTTNAIVSERDDDLYLGSMNGTNSFYRGALDDVRIYNYALASDEIQQLSAAIVTTPLLVSQTATGVVLKWPYDAAVNYRVEFAASLTPGAQWTPASGVPQRAGDVYTLTQPYDLALKFFRLRKL